ncbi:phosphotransferase [Streptosporangium sp. NPDC051023]|uniref:phosphotransferase n=1 Tax=Streptosporangium sp. NPDC051023 TaxID=3155410 RepID=UPI00344BB74A
MTSAPATPAWREPPSPARALAAAGVVADAPEVADLSRSHSVHLLAVPGGQAYAVKRLRREAWERGRSLGAELFVYRLASWSGVLAEVLPQALMIDERHQVLVLRAAGRSPAVATPELARSLGSLVASWHTATSGVPAPALASAGILYLPGTAPENWGIRTQAAVELGGLVAADPALPGLLEAGAAAWRPLCLVHGDLKWDNCLVEEGGAGVKDRLRVVDWELSGFGDPAWDVASVIAEHLAVHREAEPYETLESPVISAFMRSYAIGSSLMKHDFERRCALFTVARLIHLALEQAEHAGEAGMAGVADPTVDVARRLGADTDRLTTLLSGMCR